MPTPMKKYKSYKVTGKKHKSNYTLRDDGASLNEMLGIDPLEQELEEAAQYEQEDTDLNEDESYDEQEQEPAQSYLAHNPVVTQDEVDSRDVDDNEVLNFVQHAYQTRMQELARHLLLATNVNDMNAAYSEMVRMQQNYKMVTENLA